jgi:hypothetical protein
MCEQSRRGHGGQARTDTDRLPVGKPENRIACGRFALDFLPPNTRDDELLKSQFSDGFV